MNEAASAEGVVPDDAVSGRTRYYKKDFWRHENLKFSEPWYRLQKTARLIAKLTRGKECALLDIGCGPAALMPLLLPNIQYHGIDIAIQKPTPNLIEADLLEAPIRFNGKRFDFIVAQGVFEYFGEFQSQKFAEIARLLNDGGKFLVTYTNFDHRKKYIYPAFSNVQPLAEFRADLAQYFNIDRFFPVSYNWKHGHPSKRLVRALNMPVKATIPLLGPMLGVEYYFICSPSRQEASTDVR